MIEALRPTQRRGPVGRYAPSPTGALHLGNLRTALEAWRHCRAMGGKFILRIEDLDAPRTRAGSEEQMMEELRWLGIDWDEGPDVGGPAGPYRQSERGEIYRAALQSLDRRGRTYACSCSRRDLREASAPHGPEGPVYPGTCRGRNLERGIEGDAATAIRFEVAAAKTGGEEAEIEFEDLRLGRQRFDLRTLSGDFVIRRRDGLWAYQFACALDDSLMGVTHVVRGEDLLASTPRQIALARALDLPEPRYLHLPLVADAEGNRMAKRDGSASLGELRARGMTAAEARRAIMEAPLV